MLRQTRYPPSAGDRRGRATILPGSILAVPLLFVQILENPLDLGLGRPERSPQFSCATPAFLFAAIAFMPTSAALSPLLKQLRHHQAVNQGSQAVVVGLGGCCDRVELLDVIDGHHSPQGIRGQLLHECLGQTVVVLGE